MRSPAASAFRLSCFLLFFVSIQTDAAEVRVTLPLEGYYRPGRYMPVRVDVRDAPAGAVLRLTGQGVLPTEVATANGGARGIAPVLMLREGVRQLGWSLGEDAGVADMVPRPLGRSQRLVGFTSRVETDLARLFFPDASVIAVRVDPAELAKEHAAAWQGLDAAVVDAGVLTDPDAKGLASAGVVVAQPATRGAAPLGWERVGSYDVFRPELLGPRSGGVFPSAFAPVQGWRAESPTAFRMWVLLIAAVIAIAILGAAFVPGRRGVIAIVLVAVVATSWLHLWRRRMPAVTSRLGGVLVVTDGARVRDNWVYQASPMAVEEERRILGVVWPMFEREEDVAATGTRLVCDAYGWPRWFRYRLLPGRTIGWMQRNVHLAVPADPVAPVAGTSPMDRVAERMYLKPGYLRAGIEAAGTSPSLLTEIYPTTVIRRGPPATTGEAEPRIGR